MTANFPSEGVELTVLLVVSDLARSRAFYTDVLGATVHWRTLTEMVVEQRGREG